MAKEIQITTWKSFWDNLNWGPRGALIGFVAAVLFFLIPAFLRLLFIIVMVLVATLLGAIVGSLIEWIAQNYKKNKRK